MTTSPLAPHTPDATAGPREIGGQATRLKAARGFTWEQRADQLGEFYRTHARWPAARAADEVEAFLGRWLKTERTRARGHQHAYMSTPKRRAYLDQAAPGWLRDAEGERFEKADRLGSFRAAHGRWPDRAAADGVEAFLGRWRALQCKHAHGGPKAHRLTAELRAHLDRVAPGWLRDAEGERFVRAEGERFVRADQLGLFRSTQGRWPSGSSADQHERSLATWRDAVRSWAHGARGAHLLTPQLLARLDQAAPGWLGGREEVWVATADRVGAFHATTAHWPSAKATDPDEAALGQWLATSRAQARGGKKSHLVTPARRAYMDQVAPGWMGGREEVWVATADRVGAFRATAAHWPSAEATDPDEAALGRWMAANRAQARGGKRSHLVTPERRAYMDQVAPGWSDPQSPGRRKRVAA
jgi:hypothetical protein